MMGIFKRNREEGSSVVIKKNFINFDKEEQWLNEMSERGLRLVSYSGGKYIFIASEPGEYHYKIDLLSPMKKGEREAYISFLKETGIDVIATYGGRIYLGKKTVGEELFMYSDLDSRIKNYKRGRSTWIILGCSQIAIAVAFFILSLRYSSQLNAPFYILVVFSGLSLLVSGLFFFFTKPYNQRIKSLMKEKEIRE